MKCSLVSGGDRGTCSHTTIVPSRKYHVPCHQEQTKASWDSPAARHPPPVHFRQSPIDFAFSRFPPARFSFSSSSSMPGPVLSLSCLSCRWLFFVAGSFHRPVLLESAAFYWGRRKIPKKLRYLHLGERGRRRKYLTECEIAESLVISARKTSYLYGNLCSTSISPLSAFPFVPVSFPGIFRVSPPFFSLFPFFSRLVSPVSPLVRKECFFPAFNSLSRHMAKGDETDMYLLLPFLQKWLVSTSVGTCRVPAVAGRAGYVAALLAGSSQSRMAWPRPWFLVSLGPGRSCCSCLANSCRIWRYWVQAAPQPLVFVSKTGGGGEGFS